MDAIMLNVLNSVPKIPKKRKPKPENAKKNPDSSSPSTTPLSPSHLTIKTELPSPPRSPLHSPSTLDLDSLTAPLPLSNADESMSSSEPTTLSDYVPLSSAAENVTIAGERVDNVVAAPDPEPTLKVEPIVEKPPQLKVCEIIFN